MEHALTELTWKDHLGTVEVRLGIGRNRYRVDPGIYAVGSPKPDSPVFVSANYKLSFDSLRRELKGLDSYILVLDTKGVNVWCSAGKGTFGTEELVNRIESVGLKDIVAHRALILPQLSATGVAAHEVKKRSGFRVVYGPVRAKDIPEFMKAGMKATPQMRRVRFDLPDRLVLTPLQLIQTLYLVCIAWIVVLVLGGLAGGLHRLQPELSTTAGLLLLAWLGGSLFAPVFLPWLPGRAFSIKGATVGVILAAIAWILGLTHGTAPNIAAWFLLLPAISSFLAMNFTGDSTYTSLSGVKREMRWAIPFQAAAAVVGLGLWAVSRYI